LQNEEYINLDQKKEEESKKKEENKKATKVVKKVKAKKDKELIKKGSSVKNDEKNSTTNDDSSGSEAEERKAMQIRRNNININAPRSDRILFNTKSVFTFQLEFVDHDLRAEKQRAKITLQDRSKIEEDNTIRSLC